MLDDKNIDLSKLSKPIPTKRYFTISEVSELCQVKPHVLRYWEQEFNKLRPNKRGNRRYYQYEEVLLVRKIRDLLYGQLFTIKGARAVLEDEATNKTSTNKASLVESPMQRNGQTNASGIKPITSENIENGDLFFFPTDSSSGNAIYNFDFSFVKNEIRSIMSLLASKGQESKI